MRPERMKFPPFSGRLRDCGAKIMVAGGVARHFIWGLATPDLYDRLRVDLDVTGHGNKRLIKGAKPRKVAPI